MQLHQQTGFGPAQRCPDELGEQPDAAGGGKVGRKRKLVLGKLRGHGLQVRKDGAPELGHLDMPRRGK